MKKIIILTLLLFIFQLSFSQDAIPEPEEEYKYIDISFIQAGGTLLNMDFNSVNSALTELDLPASFDSNIVMPTGGINITGSKFDERVYARFVFSFLKSEEEYSNIKSISSLLDARIDLNIDFLKAPEHKLIGTIGYGWTALDIEFDDLSNSPTNFDDIAQNFDNQNLSSQNMQYLMVGTGYSYRFSEFSIGLEGGYRIPLTSAKWESSSTELRDGPSLSPKGFYLSAFFGFQIF